MFRAFFRAIMTLTHHVRTELFADPPKLKLNMQQDPSAGDIFASTNQMVEPGIILFKPTFLFKVLLHSFRSS
jgi:hypothetical protein